MVWADWVLIDVLPLPKLQLAEVIFVLLGELVFMKATGSPAQRLVDILKSALGDSTKVATKERILDGQDIPATVALDKVMVTLPAAKSPLLG